MGRFTSVIGLAGVGLAATALFRRKYMRRDLTGSVVLITGGSRGLGLALADELARRGAKLAICARNRDDLRRAEDRLRDAGAEVLAIPCDVTNRDQVDTMVNDVIARFSRIDILVNNAGTIIVGPLEEQTEDDFRAAMDVMFWGIYYPTMACLPHMKSQQSGNIVNITSIGGRFSMPHLLPYVSAKFAATGFSEGLRAELAQSNINVTTVAPGLMRTGSYENAIFKGNYEAEYAWFAFGSAFPLTAMSADRAARQIANATAERRSDLTIGSQALLASKLHGLFPGFTTNILSVVNRLLPDPVGKPETYHYGYESETEFTRSPVFTAGKRAAMQFNQRTNR